jgi:serine/threonine-protein kinase
MAKDPDTRFRSMDEVLAALKRVGGAAMTATVSGVGATGEYRAMGISGGYADSGPNKTSSGPHSAISGSGAIPAPLDPSGSGSLEKKGSKGVLVGAVVGVALLAAIVGISTKSKPTPAPAPTVASATAAPKPTVTAPAVPSITPQQQAAQNLANQFVKMRVNSDPDGASVKEDGYEVCSQTPCEITYKGPDADAAKDHKLLISKTGYKVETKTVKIGDSPVTVKLTRAPVQWTPPPQPQKQPEKANDDTVNGFKAVPY